MARREWAELGRGDPNALTLRQPQLEEARAAVAAAEAALDRARRDIDRAAITAPYAGRVQSKDVDIGQFVTKGTPVARIYAVDSAEIRWVKIRYLPEFIGLMARLSPPYDTLSRAERGVAKGRGTKGAATMPPLAG